MQLPTQTIFYTIERVIKEYRKFAQGNLRKKVNDITIDQGMVLSFLNRYPGLQQNEVAEMIFKDNASLTRMIELMAKKDYIKRSVNAKDRRRFNLEVTSRGHEVLKSLDNVVLANRKKALEGLTNDELKQLETILNKIIANCKN